MRPADGGPALAVPPGDPEGVREGARALTRAATAMDRAAQKTTSIALTTSADWSGPSSSSFVARTTATSTGLARLADAFVDAGRALDEFAEVLSDAQRRARTAQADLLEAGQEHAHALRAAAQAGRVDVSGMTEEAAARAARTAQTAQRWAEAGADQALRVARATAERQAAQAQDDVDAAARRATWRLQKAADSLRAATLKDLLEWLGGPDTAFGLLGLFGQGVTAKGLYDARKALLAGSFAELARMEPAGYQRVMQVAAQYGDDSLEALTAQVRWQQGVLPRLVARMSDATLPLHGLPTGQLAKALDLLAKAGVVTSVVSNAWTVLGPDPEGQNTGFDKGMAVANTVGLGMAATGSATAMGVVGLTASVGWVPVTGQVVLAVTAAYLAYDWYRDNREMVHDVVERVGVGVGRAAEWGQQELQEYADEVRRELDTARDTVVGVARDAVARGEELLEDAGELVSGARERAAGVVSAVNPFD